MQVSGDITTNNTGKGTGFLDPTNPQDLTTKFYVDSLNQALSWKDHVRVAAQVNTTIASPGATINGITMVANDRVLLYNQTSTLQNGIYIWNGAAVSMTRSLDADTANELEGAIVEIDEGTDAGNTKRQTQVNFILGTDPVLWTAFGVIAPPASETIAGIAQYATQAETNLGVNDFDTITPLKLATYVALNKFAANFGDGITLVYVIPHGLSTKDLSATVLLNSTGEVIYPIVQLDATNVTITFALIPPTTNQYRIILKK